MGEARPRGGAPRGSRLPPSSRITRGPEFRALFRKGRRKKTSHLDVFFLSSQGPEARLGMVVPKHRQRAVDRNRLKRRLREAGRRELLPRLRGCGVKVDLLIRVRKEAYHTTYRQLVRELAEVAEELCSRLSSLG